ncbi:MAG: hypothetical protein NTY99_01830, partial [DPANN group archaeon]|nr:hypothetical protein [DPANN group archaeon]
TGVEFECSLYGNTRNDSAYLFGLSSLLVKHHLFIFEGLGPSPNERQNIIDVNLLEKKLYTVGKLPLPCHNSVAVWDPKGKTIYIAGGTARSPFSEERRHNCIFAFKPEI